MKKFIIPFVSALVVFPLFAAFSPERAAVSRRCAAESMTLLKNDGALPLKSGQRVVLIGPVTERYFIIGGGSAFVHVPYQVSVTNGLERAGFVIDPASRETAIWMISRYNAEDAEQGMEKFDLNAEELQTLADLKAQGFKRIVVLLNTGHAIGLRKLADDPAVSAILSVWYPGMEGGNAIADVLSGKVNPSARLTCTWAAERADYPADATWQEARQYVPYEEDVFVGYRYFSTIPGASKKVVYPFGHGLSYTSFARSDARFERQGDALKVSVRVTNTGKVAGRHSVLLYSSVQGAKAEHPALELRAFAKTALLAPGASEVLALTCSRRDLAYFDDEGTSGRIGSWVIDRGTYELRLGGSVAETEKVAEIVQAEEEVLSTPGFKLDAARLRRRLRANGAWTETPVTYGDKNGMWGWTPYKKELKEGEKKVMLQEVARGEKTLDEFIDALPLPELTKLLCGGTNIVTAGNTCSIGLLPEYGVTGLQTADGPVGIRLEDKENETNRWATAFPATALVSGSFDLELMTAYGRALGEEAAAVGIDIHLAPGICLSRHPMCGRNFEYMGEDPLVAGKMAAAFIRGVQSQGVASTIKHFACNNRENTRNESYSIVSERAARELYLKGFEIAVREANPKCLMTSYNGINGRRTGMTWGLVTGILRDEWGYEGLVMSDWGARAQLWEEVAAGSNVKMPDANGGVYDFGYLCERGAVDPKMVRASLKRVLKLVMASPRFRATLKYGKIDP